MFTGNVCFCEKWDKRAAKARGTAGHRTARAPLLQRGVQHGRSHSPFKVRCATGKALKSSARPRRSAGRLLHDPHAALLVAARADAPIVVDGCAGCHRYACDRLGMNPCMACSCSSCSHRPRGPCSQIRQGWWRHRHLRSRWVLLAAWQLDLGRASTGYNLFRDAACCVSRERVSHDRPPQPHVSRVADEVHVGASLEPHGLNLDGCERHR